MKRIEISNFLQTSYLKRTKISFHFLFAQKQRLFAIVDGNRHKNLIIKKSSRKLKRILPPPKISQRHRKSNFHRLKLPLIENFSDFSVYLCLLCSSISFLNPRAFPNFFSIHFRKPNERRRFDLLISSGNEILLKNVFLQTTPDGTAHFATFGVVPSAVNVIGGGKKCRDR